MSSDLFRTTAKLFEAAPSLVPLVLLFTCIYLLNLVSNFKVIMDMRVEDSGQNLFKPW